MGRWIAYAAAASLVSAQGGANAAEPCSQVAALASATEVVHIDAELAYSCVQSVPFKLQPALTTLDAAERMSQFQSNLEILADPPAGYPEAKVDILGGLQSIRDRAQSGQYTKEYDFERDLTLLFVKAYDFHFDFTGALINSWIWYGRPRDLQLISAADNDGLPSIYLYEDALKPDASKIVKINGQDADKMLTDESNTNNWNNPHARYNLMFFQSAFNDYSQTDFFLDPFLYPGHFTDVVFADGTHRRYKNYAKVWPGDIWTWVNSGESLYEAIIHSSSSSAKRSIGAADGDLTAFGGRSGPRRFMLQPGEKPATPSYYPRPALEFDAGFPKIAGYFIDTPEKKHTAVLVLSTFGDPSSANWSAYEAGFAKFMQSFLQFCRNRNAEKLIIDIRGNGGGLVDLGLQAFWQLFPKSQFFQGQRLRISPTTELAIRGVAQMDTSGLVTTYTNNENPWDYRYGKTVDGKPFASADQMIGDNVAHGEHVSAVVRPTKEYLFGDVIGNTAVFNEKDVLLLSDGACGSTCSRFVEMMTQDVHVRTLAVGGRPERGQMAVAGGSKGTQTNDINYLTAMGNRIVNKMKKTGGRVAANAAAKMLPTTAGINIHWASVNSFDAIRTPDSSIPTQFLVDNAECRMWYSRESAVRPERLWLDAYRATWTKESKKLCSAAPQSHEDAKVNAEASSQTGSQSGSESNSNSGSDSNTDSTDSKGGKQTESDDDSSAGSQLLVNWVQTACMIATALVAFELV